MRPATQGSFSAAGGGRGKPTGKICKTSFGAPVRYVRPTAQERRERLYAYHAAKQILQEDNTESNTTPFSSVTLSSPCPCGVTANTANAAVTTSSTTMTIATGAAPDGTPSDVTLDAREPASENVEAETVARDKNLSPTDDQQLHHKDPASSEQRLREQLCHLVALYEKHYSNVSREWCKRTFSVPTLSQLVPDPDNQQEEEEEEEEAEKASPMTNSLLGSKLLSPSAGGDKKARYLDLTPPPQRAELSATATEAPSLHKLGLPEILRNDDERVDEAPIDPLTVEQERRTQSVRRHILKTLRRFDLASRQPRKEGGEATRTRSAADFKSSHLEDLTGVCGTLLDTPVEATPYNHVKRLLKLLWEEPTLQKCTEAAARLVTYALMRSLPVELYEGDPEDYRTLRQRSRVAAAVSGGKKREATAEGDWRTLPVPTLSHPTQHSGGSCDFSRVFSEPNTMLASCGLENDMEERYFLHQDSMSLTKALQSVALQKGIWLSSTVPMMRRPPLHACGLPMRTARHIALWQRPPDFNKDSTLRSRERFMDGTINTTTTTTTTSTTTTTTATGNVKNSWKSHVAESGEADDWRPKTLAPLLIIAFGGYRVAPFSTYEPSMASDQTLNGKKDFASTWGQDIIEGRNDTVLSAMNNFMHPEPTLLPLQAVMQVILQCVRLNRSIRTEEVTDVFPPVMFDLLTDLVYSYRDFFQTILSLSFEQGSSRSFFVRTYRETLMSWASIVICEAAIGYAAERAGQGPSKVHWTSDIMPEKFTVEEFERIVLSGLVERTFPGMTQLDYDERLFFRTVDTLRSVVLETIGRVKGELYFLMTGLDNRSAVLEQCRERLRQFRATEAAMVAEAEERLQARLHGGSGDTGKSGIATHSGMHAGGANMEYHTPPQPRSVSTNERTSSMNLRHGRSGTRCSEAFQAFQISEKNADSTNLAGCDCFQPTPALMPWKPGCKSRTTTLCMQEDSALGESNLPFFQSTVRLSQGHTMSTSQDIQSFAACTHPSLLAAKEASMLKNDASTTVLSALGKTTGACKPTRLQRSMLTGSLLLPARTLGSQSNRSTQQQNTLALPEDLTLRAVRRELVSLKFRSQPLTEKVVHLPHDLSLGSLSPARTSRMFNTVATGDDTTAYARERSLRLTAGSVGGRVAAPVTLLPPPTYSAAAGPEAAWVQSKDDNETLSSIVGPKQAASVARMLRACENTAQFYLHFQNALNDDGGGTRRNRPETQWYATGSTGFYERRAVAVIKRARQVAAFDLHHLSPITALERCVQWPSYTAPPRHAGDADEEAWSGEQGGGRRWCPSSSRLPSPPPPPSPTLQVHDDQHQGFVSLKSKKLHLGKTIVPWTL
ncbi:hypothetical protein TraAM80_07347 [Trypanosoma rangeli]|uniref:Uncharacterized protein n=1 Tax=Trypanosoma rangeli TaxID=5698 RepID=A0A422N642_TRYRA|nr:uncharacterized protein TraAM80_07347 [Trypanosoma rangeli]RNF00947.1 hypothetical protein TraAM80_07347 [Trypanosoma rangeli]|eukprot:RNF00947.1 hypothetical protein TraAM80_07347 [Trypanosoma rangeli]